MSNIGSTFTRGQEANFYNSEILNGTCCQTDRETHVQFATAIYFDQFAKHNLKKIRKKKSIQFPLENFFPNKNPEIIHNLIK
jgi:hypothetical protein